MISEVNIQRGSHVSKTWLSFCSSLCSFTLHTHRHLFELQILLRESCPVKWSNWPRVTFQSTTDYVTLCEEVFRQITLCQGEKGLYVPMTQSDFMGSLPQHRPLNWDAAGQEAPLCSTNTNTHKHILFGIHSIVLFILSPAAF